MPLKIQFDQVSDVISRTTRRGHRVSRETRPQLNRLYFDQRNASPLGNKRSIHRADLTTYLRQVVHLPRLPQSIAVIHVTLTKTSNDPNALALTKQAGFPQSTLVDGKSFGCWSLSAHGPVRAAYRRGYRFMVVEYELVEK